MKDLDGLTPELARHIVDRMGSTGQPPERGAHYVNVATEDLLAVMRDEYLRPIRASRRNSTFKLVQAPFGGGKSQFLHCLREMAWDEGFATALIGLSPKECPFDRPMSIYKEVALRIELPVKDLDEAPAQGLDLFLRMIAEARIAKSGRAGFLAWLAEEFSRTPVESRAFGRGVRAFLEAVANDDREAEDVIGDWLRGDTVDAKDVAPYRLREVLDDAGAFRWLRSLVQVISLLSLPGVVFLFDEMDRNMSLGVGRRRAIGDNLRQMIDYCGQSLLPGVVWCYAVPPEFMDTIVPEYPALAQRLKGASRFARESPLQPIIDLDHLPLAPTDLLAGIGMRLMAISERAYDFTHDHAIQDRNVRALAEELGERQFESGTRRQFVKAVVGMLEAQRTMGAVLLAADDIRRLAGSANDAGAEPMPGETEF